MAALFFKHNLLLQTINAIILILALWIAVEGVIKFFALSDSKSSGEVAPQTT